MTTIPISDMQRAAAAQHLKEKNYWLNVLGRDIKKINFPYDYQEIHFNEQSFAVTKFKLSGETFGLLTKSSMDSHIRLHIILTAGLVALLHKYSDSTDITVGMPIYKQDIEGKYINKVLALRNRFNQNAPFRELLNGVRTTIVNAVEHQDYPIEILVEDLNLSYRDNDFQLFDCVLLLEDIHDKKYIEHIPVNMIFSFKKSGGYIEGSLEYNRSLYREDTVNLIVTYLERLLMAVLSHPDLQLQAVEILSLEEKKRLLYDFNDTVVEYPAVKTIRELFAEQVTQHPDQPAVSSTLNLTTLLAGLNPGKIDPPSRQKFENCCFKKNPLVFKFKGSAFPEALNIFTANESKKLIVLRTHKLNYAAVNKPVLFLLDYFDGKTNIRSIFNGISKNKNLQFLLYTIEKDSEESDFYPGTRERILIKENFDQMVLLVKALLRSHLIRLADYIPVDSEIHMREWNPDEYKIRPHKGFLVKRRGEPCVHPAFSDSLIGNVKTIETGEDLKRTADYRSGGEIKSPVLLLGDRTGPASTGLLYIASFLRRNGIEAYCQWNDIQGSKDLLKSNVEKLLSEIRPQVVGVSMKWFPHIARVLEICRLVRKFDPGITIVVGGNTASYYKEKIIEYDCIDYVIVGDGEVPFLKLCLGEKSIPNCVYKKDGIIIETPRGYVQDEINSSDIYLSHLDQIFVSGEDPYLASDFYICTGKGCSMQCFYCGGCRDAQEKTFNRAKPFMRGVQEVRSDIIAAAKYTSTFWFDFDLPAYQSIDYYKKIWEALDLSDYFCEFYFWKLPTFEFLDYIVKTFKYVYINIDLCSLSEPHRLKLSSSGLVKPQPTDEELFAFFDHCEKYNNIEVIINQITGLPYFSMKDIANSHETLSRLLNRYSTISAMDWGRLHAQPGAPIVDTYKQYNMHCYAATFEDFLHYSKLNMEEDTYPDLLTFNYPYIYSKDDDLNSKISKFYADSTRQVESYKEEKEKSLGVVMGLSYSQLDERSKRLAGLLRSRGIGAESVVGIMVERSVEMITAMLAVLKAGGAYLPIDYNYPAKRIEYMLTESNAALLLTQSHLLNKYAGIGFAGHVIDIYGGSLCRSAPVENKDKGESQPGSGSLAFILYTSGSTGKPKGAMVEHRSVARLVKNCNYIDLTPGKRLLLTGNFVFDITTFEIWGSLLNGLNLYLADQEVILDGEKLKEFLWKNRINILHLVPQVFNHLASGPGGLEIFARLDYFLVGGDLVRPEYINGLKTSIKQLKILHMYGPTENTTFSTSFLVDKNFEQKIPLGKPISNSTVYILDKQDKLQPVGIAGELCTGGDGLARGYLNNPELTAEKFCLRRPGGRFSRKLPPWTPRKSFLLFISPHSPHLPHSPYSPIYKTGDFARWLPDGNIEFIGRIDHQVKIRGMRIELGEIERQLLSLEEIKEVVVTVNEELPPGEENRERAPRENGDQKYLCAYIVSEKAFEVSELREYLSGGLPDYMIPSYFVQIDKIPLTVNGKIDDKALPVPKVNYIKEIDPGKISSLLNETGNFDGKLEESLPISDKIKMEKTIAYFTSLLQENFFKEKIRVSGVEIDMPQEKKKKQQLFPPGNLNVKTIQEIFEEQVEKTPTKTAVVFADQQLTYRELNTKANQLASLLKAKGVKPGIVVGIMLERSLDLVTAVIGILKAGGAYISLDPGLAAGRIVSILEDCEVPVLITKTPSIDQHSIMDILNLELKTGDVIKTSTRPPIADFDRIPFPNRSKVDYEKYNRYIDEAMVKHCISLQATRGCPYKCIYCHKMWPKKHTFRSAENIFEELKVYYDIGVRRFAFIDDIFNLNIKNSTRFFQLIIENELDIQIHFPSGLRGDLLTEEYIDLMVKAGTIAINIALETPSTRLQKLIRKNLDVEKLHQNIRYFCKKYPGVIIGLFTMHGFPTETKEEALMTLNFIKSIKWLHFPYLNLLKIYQNTEMEKLALENGISREAIIKSADMAFHELPETFHFDKEFITKYKADFLNDYFLFNERLLFVLPYQMKVLSEDEIVMKYNSYLPVDIKNFDDLLQFVGIKKEELAVKHCLDESIMAVPDLNQKMRTYFPVIKPDKNALRVLLLDLSQFFSGVKFLTDELVEPPLGLMYLLTSLEQRLGSKIKGKIAKSMIDFNNYSELRAMINEFKPDVIGIRTLNLYSDFFHKTIAVIRQWGIDVPIITGGPYATSNYASILQDKNIDIVVLGEGEVTFNELIKLILENCGKLPGEEILKEIPGITFISEKTGQEKMPAREIIMLDEPPEVLSKESGENLEQVNQPTHPAHVIYNLSPKGKSRKMFIDHRNANNLIAEPGLVASFMFDASLQQLFGALLMGSSLYVVPGDVGLKGINTLEFYKKQETGTEQEASIHIRLELEQDLLNILPSSKSQEYIEPRNEIEKKLTKIWAEVLNIDEDFIGVYDNFFDLGGHSLKATLVLSKIHKVLSVKIPLAELFRLPTVEKLSGYIMEVTKEQYTSIEPVEKKEYYMLSSAQKRMYIVQQMYGQSLGYNMPSTLLLEGEGDLDKDKLVDALKALVKRHDSLRTSFIMVGEEPVQRILDKADFELEYHDVSRFGPGGNPRESEKNNYPSFIIQNFIRPFDLSKAPIMRAGLIKLKEKEHILVVDTHHIITDGVSTEILNRDLILLYSREELPALKLQYKDFSEWQNTPTQKQLLKKQEEYWIQKFKGEILVLNLPTDYDKHETNNFEGNYIQFLIPRQVSQKLEDLNRQMGVTLFMFLLAAFNILLYRYTGQEDIVVGSPVTGRNHVDLHNIIGMFVNMLSLRNRPEGRKTFREFLKDVRQNVLDSFANQDYQFDELVKSLGIERKSVKNPLFNTVLALQNIDTSGSQRAFTAHSHGLKLRPYQSNTIISRFDLTMFVREVNGRIRFLCRYSTGLFKEETIRKLGEHYNEIIDQVTSNPDIKLEEIILSSGLLQASHINKEKDVDFDF